MDLSHSYIPELPQLLFLAGAIAVGLIAVIAHKHRQRAAAPATMQGGAAAPGKILYHDAPTIRVVDSQRVDRMRKIVRLTVGAHMDILENRPGLEPRFRLTLASIDRRHDADAARIAVEFGGTQVSCGPLVEELGFNEFLLPRATREEPRCSVFHYYENGSSLDFMRIKLRSVDATAGTAELDVVQVSAQWPASQDR